ncbi:MAG: tRNA (adenosine(37)-N6)-threonylcarbamoyltransferase complex transferase subunit TsaD [Acidimicrobiales bacterium]
MSGASRQLVLGLETSCDETAAAVVADGRLALSSVVSSQVELHAEYGGVVPEIAGRAHLARLVPVVRAALAEAGIDDPGRQLACVAVTTGPGLVGALLVGVASAKALALAWDLPFVGVNHLEGHLYASLLEDPTFEPPMVVLLASGGHTLLVHVAAPGRYRLLGRTIDDAAGEAYDKVARMLGLGYPGGPPIDRLAATGDAGIVRVPRGLIDEPGCDFSFSGLKTSVLRWDRAHPEAAVADVAAAFQEAVVDVLALKLRRAAALVGAPAVCLAGGVAANSALRARVAADAAADGRRCFVPSRAMCTDNAAMVGAAGWWRWRADGPTPLDAPADPTLRLAFDAEAVGLAR